MSSSVTSQLLPQGRKNSTAGENLIKAIFAAVGICGIVAIFVIMGIGIRDSRDCTPSNDDPPRYDPNYPTYHIRPLKGWNNDPNGLIYRDGIYHAFFQYVPTEIHWNFSVHWGHAASEDLVHWTLLPIALYPSQDGPDCDGCWSGGMTFDTDGTPTIIYTAVTLKQSSCYVTEAEEEWTTNKNLAFREAVMWRQPSNAYGKLLTNWEKRGSLIPGPPKGMVLQGWRDPFMYQTPDESGKGEYILILGTGLMDNETYEGLGGGIMIYSSPKLIQGSDWQYQGVMTSGDPEDALDWECPWMLQITPSIGNSSYTHILGVGGNMWSQTHPDQPTNPILVWLGNFDKTTYKFAKAQQEYTRMDLGYSFYASNRMVIEGGEVLIWGWLTECMTTLDPNCAGHDYAGALALPRLLKIQNDTILSQVPPQIKELRGDKIWSQNNFKVQDQFVDTFSGKFYHYELKIGFERVDGVACGILFARGNLSMLISYNWETSTIVTVPGSQSFLTSADPTSSFNVTYNQNFGGKLQNMQGQNNLTIDVFVDGSSVEIFTSTGQVVSVRLYYDESVEYPQEKVQVFSYGGSTKVISGDCWSMNSIWDHSLHSSILSQVLKQP